MNINPRRIKIFKIKNRRGYAAIYANHLTEGKTMLESYDRMLKALRRNGITIKNKITDIKKLLTKV